MQYSVAIEASMGLRNELNGGRIAGLSLYSNKVKRRSVSIIRSMYGAGRAGSDANSGDPQVQQMLVNMVRIQVGKARMIDFVDERSNHLRSIAEDAVLEYDRIAYRTMKGLDATGSRVLRELDAGASAIEKDLMIVRAELEAQSRDFEAFQIRIAYSRNEGLFFKNLYKSPESLRFRAGISNDQLEKKVVMVAKNFDKDLGAHYRHILYGGLSLVMVSFIWSSGSAFIAGTCMRASKLASYGVIFSLLLAQLAYANAVGCKADDVEGGHE